MAEAPARRSLSCGWRSANGGFGPGYGVMGVEGGFTDDLGHTVADLFEVYRQPDPEDPTWEWPERFLPICHWGCVVYSGIDCGQNLAPVYLNPLFCPPKINLRPLVISHGGQGLEEPPQLLQRRL